MASSGWAARAVRFCFRSWMRYLTASALVVVAISLFLVPQFRDALHDLSLLKRIPAWWIAAGAALESLSFVAYALFTRGVLPAEGRPSFHRLLRVDVVGAGLTHVIPGGGAVASGLRFKMLRDDGVDGAAAALGSVVQGLGSAIVVAGLMLVGVALVPGRGGSPLYVLGGVVGAVLLALVVLGWVMFVRAEAFGIRTLRRATARLGHAEVVERGFQRVSERVKELAANPRMLVSALVWSVLNWLLDAASLWVFVVAFGYRVDVGEILVAFGLANTLAILPLTPGGVGIIEGVLVPSLVGFGTPKSIALLGVLTWRVFNYWAPIPAGGVAWASLGFLGMRRRSATPAA